MHGPCASEVPGCNNIVGRMTCPDPARDHVQVWGYNAAIWEDALASSWQHVCLCDANLSSSQQTATLALAHWLCTQGLPRCTVMMQAAVHDAQCKR